MSNALTPNLLAAVSRASARSILRAYTRAAADAARRKTETARERRGYAAAMRRARAAYRAAGWTVIGASAGRAGRSIAWLR